LVEIISYTAQIKRHGILDESSLRVVTPNKMLLIDLFNNQEGSKTTEVKFITWTIGFEITTK
jgi:hypothetical protein